MNEVYAEGESPAEVVMLRDRLVSWLLEKEVMDRDAFHLLATPKEGQTQEEASWAAADALGLTHLSQHGLKGPLACKWKGEKVKEKGQKEIRAWCPIRAISLALAEVVEFHRSKSGPYAKTRDVLLEVTKALSEQDGNLQVIQDEALKGMQRDYELRSASNVEPVNDRSPWPLCDELAQSLRAFTAHSEAILTYLEGMMPSSAAGFRQPARGRKRGNLLDLVVLALRKARIPFEEIALRTQGSANEEVVNRLIARAHAAKKRRAKR